MQTEGFVLETPVGRLEIFIQDRKVKSIELNSVQPIRSAASQFAQNVAQQLNRYFETPKFCFELPIIQEGTEHQNRVWAALGKIPFGSVMTYGALAKKIGSSARAIGNACRNNPVPIIVPCHRIVAAKDIGGFSGAKQGALLNIKRDLLRHEGLSF